MIKENISLKHLNTFGMNVFARWFAAFTTAHELTELLKHAPAAEQSMILGGGSNILFTKNYDGIILQNKITGIELIQENDMHVWLRVGAGENWHQFVLYCIGHGWGGVENLSLIPGCAGASPMQNIGAYGVEIKDVFDSLEALHLADNSLVTFNHKDCEFGYRESVFKRAYKNQFAITHVTFRLHKQPVFHTSYGAIQQELEAMGITMLSIKAISDAVIRIRQSKLPDPAVTGNAGSFFKNPEIPDLHWEKLKAQYPTIPGYASSAGNIKVPAGWLIETAGWKGYRKGDAGVHPKQALVLVNYGDASGEEIFRLSQEIMDSVKERFGIGLEREVNLV